VAKLDETLGRFGIRMVSAKTRSMAFAAMPCEFCGFLEWVSQMGLTDVEIPNRTRDGGSRKRLILSLAELSPGEVHQNVPLLSGSAFER
jgi:hypothetical protein